MTIKEITKKANTGADAIKRAPIVKHDTGIKCIRIQDISNDKEFRLWGYCQISENNYEKFSLKSGDILIARTGNTIGVNKYIENNLNAVFNNGLIRLRVDEDKVIPKYIYYNLRTRNYKSYIIGIAGGTSTQPNMQINDLLNYEFNYFDLDTQKRIVDFISNFDDKIDLIRRQNETMEQIAQTLFKRWFVEFEFPYDFAQGKPDLNGQPYKSSGGEMVASELGEIPKGWEVGRIGDVCHNHSRTFKFEGKESIIFINTGDVSNGQFLHSDLMKVDLLPGQAKKSIEKGDILYSEIRPINRRFAYVNIDTNNYVVSTKFMVIRSNQTILSRLLYLILKQERMIEEFQLIAESRSGTFPQITFESISSFSFPLPNKSLQTIFMESLLPIIDKQELNLNEISTLKKVRDLLLPKLMSGQIRVKT